MGKAVTLEVFTAKWSPVTIPLRRALEEVRQSGVSVKEIDVDEDAMAADAVGITVLPTFLRRDGDQYTTRVGAQSAQELVEWCLEEA